MFNFKFYLLPLLILSIGLSGCTKLNKDVSKTLSIVIEPAFKEQVLDAVKYATSKNKSAGTPSNTAYSSSQKRNPYGRKQARKKLEDFIISPETVWNAGKFWYDANGEIAFLDLILIGELCLYPSRQIM